MLPIPSSTVYARNTVIPAASNLLVQCSFISPTWIQQDAPAYKNKNNNNILFILIRPAQTRRKNVPRSPLSLSRCFSRRLSRGEVLTVVYYYIIFLCTGIRVLIRDTSSAFVGLAPQSIITVLSPRLPHYISATQLHAIDVTELATCA